MANFISDASKVREIDVIEKNKFRFEWLTKAVKIKHPKGELDVSIGDTIKKVDVSGKALCSICNDLIYYGKRGCSALTDHLKSTKHTEKIYTKKENYSLPSNFFVQPNKITAQSGPSHTSSSILQNVPVCDRISYLEAMVLGVILNIVCHFQCQKLYWMLEKH